MKNLFILAAVFLLLMSIVFPTRAAFSSIYIFGDGACTTTTNGEKYPFTTNYYGLRNSNGRVWVEVLAQQLGLTNNYWYSTNSSIHVSYTNLSASSTNWSYSSNNLSFYGNSSSILVTSLNKFAEPPNASNALFIVWVNDADFVGDMGSIYPSTNIVTWTNAINLSLSSHYLIISNLYAKGALTLIMPNAVDITEIPAYDNLSSANKSFIRQRIIDFDVAFSSLLTNATASFPGLTIYEPDIFSLLDNVLTNSAAYGLTNVLSNGQSADVFEYGTDKSLNGSGTNWIFWDTTDPTAKFHAVIAGVVRQLLSPPQISQIKSQNGTNQLALANVPVGLNGFVNGSTDLMSWTSVTNVSSTNATETVFVPMSGPEQFYRLNFPFTWTWP